MQRIGKRQQMIFENETENEMLLPIQPKWILKRKILFWLRQTVTVGEVGRSAVRADGGVT